MPLLSPIQKTLLMVALLSGAANANEANYIACAHGFSDCNEALLSDRSHERKDKEPRDLLTAFADSSKKSFRSFIKKNPLPKAAFENVIQADEAGSKISRYNPRCAENGSCYGDISPATGRPKTVQVQGYYRSDGTYVRGHYRSKPR